MIKKKERFRTFFLNTGLYCTALTCFSIPLSTAMVSVFSALTVLCWLLSGSFFKTPSIILTKPHAFAATLLFFLFIVGLYYTPVNIEEGISGLKKYRELFFIPIILSLFSNNPKAATFAINSFAGGAIILMLSSYLIHLDLIPYDHYGDSHIHHITHSFFMAILAYWSMQKFTVSWQYKYYWLLVFFLASLNLIIVAPGRTGMFVYMVLATLFLIQKLTFKKLIVGLMAICAVFSVVYISSDNIATRLNEATSEIKHYDSGKSRTSVGMRFDWYQNSIELIKQKPILGHGTGSFAYVQGKLIEGTKTVPTDNPHNEYLFIGAQLGLVGLSVFLIMFFLQFLGSFNLDSQNRNMLQGVIISMMAGCLINSFLFDSLQGHYFAFLVALLFSSTQQICPISIKR